MTREIADLFAAWTEEDEARAALEEARTVLALAEDRCERARRATAGAILNAHDAHTAQRAKRAVLTTLPEIVS